MANILHLCYLRHGEFRWNSSRSQNQSYNDRNKMNLPIITRLDRPVSEVYDHILGPENAEITLVEYGSYDCRECRIANERIADIRDKFGDRLRYVFRHRPLPGSEIAQRAAELVEQAPDVDSFWRAHLTLMTRSDHLLEEDLQVVADDFGVSLSPPPEQAEKARHAQEHVEADKISARASGVRFTPTFFINDRRYDGPWDQLSFADEMLGSLGHRVRSAALDFVSWAPSTGVLLLVATVLAIVVTNTAFGTGFLNFWTQYAGISFGSGDFRLSLQHWVNDGLLTIFFLVVGLEIKREFTTGRLSRIRSAAMPIAGAIGGMVIPAIVYRVLVGTGSWDHGWGIPMATDTAFAVALIVMLGSRVPVELRIFLTAAAIVDDIGAIIVVALFYSGELSTNYLLGAAALLGLLIMMNKSGVYRVVPYVIVGVVLWFFILQSGLHATLAGVLLAVLIPTRPPPNLHALMTQIGSIVRAETRPGDNVLKHGLSTPALRALDAIHDRIESPADRVLRHVEPWSSYVVLPVFALANAGVMISWDVFSGHEPLMIAILVGLAVGKPIGMLLVTALAVRLGLAEKPDDYSWFQLFGAGSLAGIGFTMSLFIAGQAFPSDADFAAAKIAVFAASVLSAILGVTLLWAGSRTSPSSEQDL